MDTPALTPSKPPQPDANSPESEHEYTWLWIAIGAPSALALLIYWLGWTTFITIVLWIVIAACALVAIGCGYAAIEAKDSKERKELWIACGGAAAITVVVWLFIPSSSEEGDTTSSGPPTAAASEQGDATFRYWSELRRISLKGKPLESRIERASTPQQMASVLRAADTTLNDMAREIRNTSIKNVDPDVVTYASEIVTVFNNSASIFRDFANFVDEAQSLQEHAGSFEAGLESFVRGFFGDPFGKHNELTAYGQQLEARRQQLLTRWSNLEQTINTMNATEMQLRSQLAQKYMRDFPRLDD